MKCIPLLTWIPLQLIVAVTSSAAPEGERAFPDTSAVLTYTYKHASSQVMKQLPSKVFQEGTPSHEITLASWRSGNPCDIDRMRLFLGSMPREVDVFTLCDEMMLQYGDAFRSFPTEFINENTTPNLSALRDHHPNIFGDYIEDSEFLAIPGINELYDLPTVLPILREDWIESAYGDVSGRRIPLDSHGVVSFIDHDFTIDQLYDILIHIASSGTLPQGRSPVAHGGWEYTWPTLFGAFGLSTIRPSRGTDITPMGVPNVRDSCTEEVVANVVSCQYRDLVDTVELWYANGLIEDYASNVSVEILLQQLLSGEVAAILSLPILRDWDSLVSKAIENDTLSEEARFVIVPPPIGTSRGTMRWRESVFNGTFFAMSRYASDEQVIAALQILDYIKLTPEGFVLENYGIEGIHYDWLGTAAHMGIPGVFYSVDDDWPYFPRFPIFRTPVLYPVAFEDSVVKLIGRLSSDVSREWAISPVYWWRSPSLEVQHEFISFGNELNSFIRTSFWEMVVGERPSSEIVDPSSPFRQQLLELGLDQALELTVASHDTQ